MSGWDDNMTFACDSCDYRDKIEFDSRDYFAKENIFKALVARMKIHVDETGHQVGSVYHKGEKFLRVNKPGKVEFV